MKTVWEYIEDMLSYKESLGFSRKTYEGFLRDFGKFVDQRDFAEFNFSKSLINEWCTQRATEKESGFRKRVTVLREFSKYLYAMGVSDYIVPTDMLPSLHRYTPYIFTDRELNEIFKQSDLEICNRADPAKHLIIPVIYKLIYFCGLRPNEGRELMKKDVDLEVGTLFIHKNKSHRERLIPMSDDITEMCHFYKNKLDIIYPESKYFFPSPSGLPYSAKWLTKHFLKLWNASRISENTARVRVYDLRHRYATAIFMKWLDKKVDLYAMLPYLSTYMGHARLEDTAYYIHLLPEKLTKSSSIDWNAFQNLFPEADDYE